MSNGHGENTQVRKVSPMGQGTVGSVDSCGHGENTQVRKVSPMGQGTVGPVDSCRHGENTQVSKVNPMGGQGGEKGPLTAVDTVKIYG